MYSGDMHEQVRVKPVADIFRGLFHTSIRRHCVGSGRWRVVLLHRGQDQRAKCGEEQGHGQLESGKVAAQGIPQPVGADAEVGDGQDGDQGGDEHEVVQQQVADSAAAQRGRPGDQEHRRGVNLPRVERLQQCDQHAYGKRPGDQAAR